MGVWTALKPKAILSFSFAYTCEASPWRAVPGVQTTAPAFPPASSIFQDTFPIDRCSCKSGSNDAKGARLVAEMCKDTNPKHGNLHS